MNRRIPLAVTAFLLLIASLCFTLFRASTDSTADTMASAEDATFVGSETCAGCHQGVYHSWRDSQHARAMQHARAETVLGDFNGVDFKAPGIAATFLRRDNDFMIRTAGPEGPEREFKVLYTFGVSPLQQYLLDVGRGRLQAFSVAWDSRPVNQGGQRWFSLDTPDGDGAAGPAHWLRPDQNWNAMCADCHVTNFQKNYLPEQERFESRFSELGVGCESCHGPASMHIRWARGDKTLAHSGLQRVLDAPRQSDWRRAAGESAAHKVSKGQGNDGQEVCAQCHSLRHPVREGMQDGGAFLDHYRPELIHPPLYHADGQQRAEVFITGSFEQSRMAMAGVSCVDCHDPHTQQTYAPDNTLCTRCHAEAQFDRPDHHFHPPGAEGAQCVNCHMPETTYMKVDPRRDHRIAVPRPDLSVTLGVPNACNGCHDDKSPAWAARQLREQHPDGRWRTQHHGMIFSAADAGDPSAQPDLRRLSTSRTHSPMVQASAAARLDPLDRENRPILARLLRSDDPLLRQGALESAAGLPAEERTEVLAPLLKDQYRSLRSSAARLLAGAPNAPPALSSALEDYEKELRLNSDRAEYLNRKALLEMALRRDNPARHWLLAIERDPSSPQSYLNLASYWSSRERESKGEAVLLDGLSHAPTSARLHEALGLSLVRQRRNEEALDAFQKAHRLQPGNPRYSYVLAVALFDSEPEQALSLIDDAIRKHPFDHDLLWAAASFNARAGRRQEALIHAQEILSHYPEDQRVRRLLDLLQ
ncbi:multiheme c-type cytochrome [Alloalcanivorax marinus]|uniref:multiheme c-type cytochrome n=1 Tax=Alloalcanivorax marinus TaxID=1177169 RepID=UPI001933A923|nr:multiheme c-type cytochrome [Alloalcanivorax marinus]MBL7251257.1 tetratricopeptide repeat protein [Alloalcanivorax marinus]